MTRPLTLGLAQMTGSPYEAGANRRRSAEWSRRAFGRGADIVVLPELIIPGYALDPGRLRQLAEPLNGPSVTAWLEVAEAHGGYVVAGFCEREGQRLYNTAVLVGDGQVLLHYRKLHLFSAEKGVFAPGDRGLPVASTQHGMIGLCVCYDLRFVETLRILALEGAELVCVPTAWVAGFDRDETDRSQMPPQAHGALLQANLNQVFLACASQVGAPGDFDLLGGSIVADPYGQPACGPLSGDNEELAVVEIDRSAATLALDRGDGINPRGDRRTDVYSVTVGGRPL